MVGKPVIKGTRLTVEFILNLLAHGSNVKEVLDEYEVLTAEDIQACLFFASQWLSGTAFMPAGLFRITSGAGGKNDINERLPDGQLPLKIRLHQVREILQERVFISRIARQ